MLPTWAFPCKQGSWTLRGASEFAPVPANGSSQLCLVLSFPQKDKVCWLFSPGVVFLFCKPRVKEETGTCFTLVFLACPLHWQAGLRSLGQGERELQVCPESKAFTLAESGLGEGRCTHPWPGKTVSATCSSGLPPDTPSQAGDKMFFFRARKRHCSELWRCPWQSQHAAQRSHPGTAWGNVVSCPKPACERCLGQHHVALG